MKLSKSEKELLFRLLDVMTDRCPEFGISHFDNDYTKDKFMVIFRKLRLDLLGY